MGVRPSHRFTCEDIVSFRQTRHPGPLFDSTPWISDPLRICGAVGGFLLVDHRVHRSAYFGSVALVSLRDGHPTHGGAVSETDAIERAMLFAHAEPLEQAARRLLHALMERPPLDKPIQAATAHLSRVLDMISKTEEPRTTLGDLDATIGANLATICKGARS